MEFSSWKTYCAMMVGVGVVVIAAVMIFIVASPDSGAAQPASPVLVSRTAIDTRGEQPTPASYVRVVPTTAPTSFPQPVSMEQPRVTYFIPPDADQSVKDALGDGIVSFEEYTRAVNNTMSCLDEKGAQHTKPVYDEERGQYVYGVTSPAGPGGVSTLDDCWMRYERDVQGAWVKASPPLKVVPVNEKGALECAAKFGLAAKTFQDIVALKRANPQDVTIQHCYVIGTNGYDPSVQRNP
ncbi:MAG: hypothetical protein ABI782_06130 [Anaerolineaceae bacterium]